MDLMHGLKWRFPSERDWERLDELREQVERFPDSLLVQAWRHEIEYLEKLLNQ